MQPSPSTNQMPPRPTTNQMPDFKGDLRQARIQRNEMQPSSTKNQMPPRPPMPDFIADHFQPNRMQPSS
jgi:hypothetical protein